MGGVPESLVNTKRTAKYSWSVLHFSQANPQGRGQDNVAALLRRVAVSIGRLGEVIIQDIAFHSEIDDDGNERPNMTVYYHRRQGRTAARRRQ